MIINCATAAVHRTIDRTLTGLINDPQVPKEEADRLRALRDRSRGLYVAVEARQGPVDATLARMLADHLRDVLDHVMCAVLRYDPEAPMPANIRAVDAEGHNASTHTLTAGMDALDRYLQS
ncbi:Uncharacterised protein [Mycobacteroides abscessus subsp. abscessus]|uniref:hypothetical protein n=1 Tax=Mycobacteroides abscessus TaxID=36809 RepID=UPI000929A46C|nr:hypothetical protein [Mycobacteroides abscessus]SIA42902.1 Uncharacterised protein [Mycobacteroides abscessus subsp. abscessus]SIA56179.1 Uncharacterised protein [Mycobacteroides abscessus subsp. abscessus]